MGHYTELCIGVKLAENVPDEVVAILKHMIEDAPEPEPLPDASIFKTDRWHFMLQCGSYYHPVSSAHTRMRKDGIDGQWELSIRCNLKNYDDEIQKFINWLNPYIENPADGEFMGYMRYEEGAPELLYVGKKLEEEP